MRPEGSNQNKIRKILRLPLKVYLLYFVVATLVFTGVTFSRYSAEGSGSDTARVAMVLADASGAVATPGDELDVSTDANDTYVYNFTVTNKVDDKIAEVTLKYTIHVTVKGPHPALEVSMSDAKINGTLDSQSIDAANTATDYEFAFVSSVTLPAGVEASRTHALTLRNTVKSACEEFEISAWVEAEQVD